MIVGMAGHVDHGKTSLVHALTGVDTDRLKEEKARGITIELGFAYLPQPDGSVIGFVDMPGHEKFVRTMAAGAAAIDLLLLVIAADDGVMPQTREHLDIARLLGVPHAIVALSKADAVTPERSAEAEAQIAAFLAETPYAGAPIIPVSALSGRGLSSLAARIAAEAAGAAEHDLGRPFRLSVDRCFTLAGAGTVVTGAVLSGEVAVGDTVAVSPAGLQARVRSIHAQNQPAERGRAGDRCALNLAGPRIDKDAIRRGDMILDPALHLPTARIDAEFSLLAGEKRPLAMWMPVRLHHGAAEVGARVVLLQEQPIAPGGSGKVQLVLEEPIAAVTQGRFVLRDTSGARTIGGGRFLDLRPPERRRRSPLRLAQLQALAEVDPVRAMAGLLATEARFVDFSAFVRDRGLSLAERAAIVQALDLVLVKVDQSEIAFSPSGWATLREAVADTLRRYHEAAPDLPGMGIERLRSTLVQRLPAPVLRAVLGALAASGEVVLLGAWVRRPEHEVRLTERDEQLWARIAPAIGGAERFRPPRVRDLGHMFGVPEEEVRSVLKRLARRGDVHEVAQDQFFPRAVVAEMVCIAADLAAAEPAGFVAAQFRDRLDNGRKVAIQILEFFDRHRVTIRRGDRRRINPPRLDLFAPADAETGREASPVGRPDFKSGRGRQTVFGGFDSHSLPPISTGRHA